MMVEGEEFVEGGIFPGEGVRPRRSSGEKGGVFPSVLSYYICYCMLDLDAGGGWNFSGRWSLSRRMSGGRLSVSFELLNMLLHVTPGRREFFRGGSSCW